MFRNWEFLIAEIWGHLLVAIVLTIGLAWILWGTRARGQQAEMVKLRSDLERAQTEMGAKEIELSRAFTKQEQLKDRMSDFQSKLADSQMQQKTAEEAAAAHQMKLSEALEKQEASKQQLRAAQEKLSAFKAAAAKGSLESADPIESTDGQLRSLRERISKGSQKATSWVKEKTDHLFGKAN